MCEQGTMQIYESHVIVFDWSSLFSTIRGKHVKFVLQVKTANSRSFSQKVWRRRMPLSFQCSHV